jgi:Beta-fructosidases (levanase/invertase)
MRYLLFIFLFNTALAQKPAYYIPVITGPFLHIFNPNDTRPDSAWYTNDHTFVKDNKGQWHAFGIIHHQPVKPWDEHRFFHITANSLKQSKWQDHGYAMTAQPGKEKVLWAPHVIKNKSTYHMFYNIGNMQESAPNTPSWGQLCLATSNDLFNWTRHPRNPIFSDPGHARDSYIMKYKGRYYYYYTKTFNEVDLRSCVAVRTGPDLFHWSGPAIAHVQPFKVDWGGDAESPFVVRYKGLFYLFICRAMTAYNQTDVYWSDNPEHFPNENLVGTLPVHAAEIIFDKKEGWFISNTGWDKKGLYLAPMAWEPAKQQP